MNQQLWHDHLHDRIRTLEHTAQRLRIERNDQRRRAEMWKARALHKPKRLNAGVRAVSGREPAHRPPSQRGGL